jgi:hypothetical protein
VFKGQSIVFGDITSRKIRWAGDTARMEIIKNEDNVLVEKSRK